MVFCVVCHRHPDPLGGTPPLLRPSLIRPGPVPLLRLSLIPIVNNFFILGVDFLSKMRYTICIESERLKIMRNLPTLPEATWEITFDNDSTVFIAGRDEAHARRVVENNKGFSRWRRTPECEWQIRTIKKIERVTW